MSDKQATHQRNYRARRTAKLKRYSTLEAGINEALALLANNDRPLAVKLREVLERAKGESQ